MLLYGDPAFDATLPSLLAALSARLITAAKSPTTDSLRTLLIHAGQAEQALADARDADPALTPFTEALARTTDHIAAAFFAPSPAHHLQLARVALAQATASAPPTPLHVKLPEGYAFYTLYPDQYAAAARAWARAHAGARPGPIALIGIRSIGTSLSALAAAALKIDGWHVSRTTLRPTGHPFRRTATINPAFLRGHTHALIIDEGPGLSGSSMAAAAAALVAAGLARDRIAFLPSHVNPPGPAATPETKAWWSTTPCYTADLRSTPLGPAALLVTLAASTADLNPASAATPLDLSGGRWRPHAFSSPAEYPPTCDTLERSKYLFPAARGQSTLWKFAGLAIGPTGQTGAESEFARLTTLAEQGWTPAPLATTLGYIATPWLRGRRLTPADGTPETLAHIARYLSAAATTTLSPETQLTSLNRLADMLITNTRESLGDPAAARAQALADAARRALPNHPTPAAPDGRLAPHKWLRTPEGRLYKLDAAGHDTDHTCIGPQPLAWDLAGTIVEWRLTESQTAQLLDAFPDHRRRPALLTFHTAAYTAFRLAILDLARATADAADQARIAAATARHRSSLAALLPQSIPTAPRPAPPPPCCSHTKPTAHNPQSSARSPTPG